MVRQFETCLACVALLAGAAMAGAADTDLPRQAVRFNRDIRPILADRCFTCHGPDAANRQAGLRLDLRDEATGELESGVRAIVPGDSTTSALLDRIASADPDARMPPPDQGGALPESQIDLLRQWIEQGAEYEGHWSFTPPVRSEFPVVSRGDWASNPVDLYILAWLEATGRGPSPRADRRTLVRRLSFDLLGLPATPQEVAEFEQDARPDAYHRVVERILASPRFGERMAMMWLDLVRYADTVGYHGDQDRSIWPYRDWVIRAFNDNMPFDRFTIDQLAGDLVPRGGLWEKVASGYNMLGMTTIEGGAQEKEYLAKYASDRVRNASSVWLGVTLGCAECHDHKFDPFTTQEFYRFAAFFADLRQKGVGDPIADLYLPTEAQSAELARLEDERSALATAAHPAENSQALEKLDRQLAELRKQLAVTIPSVSVEPRVTRVFPRGDWLNETGEVVEPGTPRALPPLGESASRPNRLDLAEWLIDRENPLTARVMVNRVWALLFGAGLSNTLEDLGSQGEWPSHPELLDYLAVEFMEGGWDFKALVRLIVASSAYRQSSELDRATFEADPQNRLVGRQGRFRLPAEMIRDRALAASGLLVPVIGGRSVKPYQPEGYYKHLNFPPRTYVEDTGESQYRRGLYTHWQRTFLHPALIAFDAPSREECAAKRPISNTPKGALVLLNDPSFVEASRKFAERMLREGGADDDQRIRWAWLEAFGRHPQSEEFVVVSHLLDSQRSAYAANPAGAQALAGVGQTPRAADLDAAEVAAWTAVARVLLNLSEGITRP